jgi:hypothetical protein
MTDTVPSPGYLVLEDPNPQHVWIKLYNHGGTPSVGFARHVDGTYHAEGVKWKCPMNSEFAKFVTFVLTTGLTDVDCEDLWYSPTGSDGADTKQSMCILPANEETTYHFIVNSDANGALPIDPKIVVTPLPSM